MLTNSTRPQVVVHCKPCPIPSKAKKETHKPPLPGAANRFPDKVDKDPQGTRAINVEATRALARLCAARAILLIYISTDYVFPGRPGEAPYEADTPPAPTNLYGQTKLDGEQAVLDTFREAGKEGLGVVFRVPVLYGPAHTNAESAVNVLMDAVLKVQKGEELVMDAWSLRYPTNTEDVGRVLQGGFLGVLVWFGWRRADHRYRCCCSIPRGKGQGEATAGSAVFGGGQVYKVRDLPAVCRDHGHQYRQDGGKQGGQRPQCERAAAVRLPSQHQGAQEHWDRCVDAVVPGVVEAGVQGV